MLTSNLDPNFPASLQVGGGFGIERDRQTGACGAGTAPARSLQS